MHHVEWFSRGGSTSVRNGVLLCRRHHRRLHKPGWKAVLHDDASFDVIGPDGVMRTSYPPGRWRTSELLDRIDSMVARKPA